MEGVRLETLEILDIIRATGTIGYSWDLETDLIDWRGPLNLLLSPEAPFKSGSSYHNFLSPQNFYKRVQALTNLKAVTHEYHCSYNLTLPNFSACPVLEEGEVFFDREGKPYKLQGTLTFLEDDLMEAKAPHSSGYDSLTGLPEKEIMLETLSCFIDQAALNHQGGAYIAVTVDGLESIAGHYGFQTTQTIIQRVGEALRGTIRFDDFIGRPSGCGFGLILKDCDHWGLIRAYQRIVYALKELKVNELDPLSTVSISLGGVIFPREGFTPAKIISKAERYLFESQDNKVLPHSGFDPSYFSSYRNQQETLRWRDRRSLQAHR